MPPRRLLVLSVYPEDQAGTRLRAHQFAPALERAGVEVTFWSFLSVEDSRRWFQGASGAERAHILIRSAVRVLRLVPAVRRSGAVLVLREVLPVASSFVERVLARRRPLIWDVDDAVWTDYPRLFATWVPRRLRRSAGKYERLAGVATEVWAGSEVLAAWCRQHAASVHVLPTVVDLEAAPRSTGREPVLAWVGSASTAPFLLQVLPALRRVRPPMTLRVVGAGDALEGDATVHSGPWSEQAETELLRRARVGLYPVDVEHPLGPGKAGLKAVLYMAHGVPCVVTPTETIAGLVRDGIEGLHASTEDQWQEHVQRLLEDDALWQSMSDAGRARVRADFSLERWSPWVVDRVLSLPAGRS